ncbi:hypothetical protein QYE76_013184 [Lolium multiflorum]|uniref:Reverse transcriptase Ty1/copia-type domain-containing protein n=1 Tax=Lolium multiflorum TaxID=4521 RepID=A0AAD8U0L9_LOLMU|nr:hypothetical protein QYE76_013184 [Lolium multiflorum]
MSTAATAWAWAFEFVYGLEGGEEVLDVGVAFAGGREGARAHGVLARPERGERVLWRALACFEPLKVHEALVDPDWVIAMQEELECFTRNEVWSLVERPKDHCINVTGTKWVFKNKQDENGIVIRNKTRKFEMSMMGELKFFLGFQVRQLAKGTFISQEKYVKDMLKNFNMTNASPMKTPMPVKGQLGSCDGDGGTDSDFVPPKTIRGKGPMTETGGSRGTGRTKRKAKRKKASSSRHGSEADAYAEFAHEVEHHDPNYVPNTNLKTCELKVWTNLRQDNPYVNEEQPLTEDKRFWTRAQFAMWEQFYEPAMPEPAVKPRCLNCEFHNMYKHDEFKYVDTMQAGEIDNLTVSLGQSTLVVLCRFHVGAGIPGVAPHYIPPPSTFNVLLGSSWFHIGAEIPGVAPHYIPPPSTFNVLLGSSWFLGACHDPSMASSFSSVQPKKGVAKFFKSLFHMCKHSYDVNSKALRLAQSNCDLIREDFRARGLELPEDPPEMASIAHFNYRMPPLDDAIFAEYSGADIQEEKEEMSEES